jgi:hypothetical protein
LDEVVEPLRRTAQTGSCATAAARPELCADCAEHNEVTHTRKSHKPAVFLIVPCMRRARDGSQRAIEEGKFTSLKVRGATGEVINVRLGETQETNQTLPEDVPAGYSTPGRVASFARPA